ncbi:hypothetical protein B0H13DRAFT_2342042 [Mycena leptocephala]|nr:hypothetical protein B0H13DRAFT_2342042 [Mycena leptocephala]
MASASRTELLQWLNDLLQLSYTKVEQCGAGGAYLQILSSICDIARLSYNLILRDPAMAARSRLLFGSPLLALCLGLRLLSSSAL